MMPLELPTDGSSYTFLGKIGQGAFASVWKAQTTVSSQSPSQSQSQSVVVQEQQEDEEPPNAVVTVAIKVLNLDHVDSDLQEIRMEVQLMRLSLHPNLLFCYTAFLEQTQLWVVTPFMNKGSSVSCLQHARQSLMARNTATTVQTTMTTSRDRPSIKNNQPQQLLSMEPHILYILQQTLLGLQYIHDNGQIHRDIKGSNILLNGAGEVKIADFGVSGWLIPQNEKAKTFVGTPCWMAPGA
jgi:serine/threonine-protein kinase OSR1/STK39